MLIWIIDEEWPGYEAEKKVIYEKYPDCDLRFSKNDYAADLEAFGKNADAVICQISVDMGRETIEKLDNCKVISVYGVGYNNVDIEAAREKGIRVCNVPGYCAEDVSDYVIAAIYDRCKLWKEYSAEDGLWGAQAAVRPVYRVSSQKLFILGFGRIGRMIARKALGADMQVAIYDPYVTEEAAAAAGVKKVSLEEGLAEADFVSLNMIMCDETAHMISKDELALMKKTAYIINASRGGTLDTKALIEAVQSGRIAGATLDVLEEEPPQADDPVLHCPGIKVTPHISFYSEDSLNELQESAAKNALRILDGEDIAEIVNR
ncbi:MAG: C-terminal binding protein [Wujia sp.]